MFSSPDPWRRPQLRVSPQAERGGLYFEGVWGDFALSATLSGDYSRSDTLGGDPSYGCLLRQSVADCTLRGYGGISPFPQRRLGITPAPTPLVAQGFYYPFSRSLRLASVASD